MLRITSFFRRAYYSNSSKNIPIEVSEELVEDFSMDIPDNLLSEWQAYCVGDRKVNSIEALNNVITLLENINRQNNNNKYYSLKLQKILINTLFQQKETTIIMPSQAIIHSLDNDDSLSNKELNSLESLCDEGLINCKKFAQFNTIISDKLSEFTQENQKDLKLIFDTAKPFSDEGETRKSATEGFYFCKNKIKERRTKNAIKAIKEALVQKPSYVALMQYGEREASAEKKLVFPRFIEKFNTAKTLDELYTLIVEGHSSKSEDPETIKLNSEMIRNTGCGFCGLFGLFYRSTTHRYLNQVEKDFKEIVDEYFENNVRLKR